MFPEQHDDQHAALSAQLATLPARTLCAVWEYTELHVHGPEHDAMVTLRGLLLDEWDRRGLGPRVDAWIDAQGLQRTTLSPRKFLL